MRKLFAAILAIAMIFTLCACGSGDGDEKERDCGIFITVEADDIYTVSCATDSGSESSSNADGESPLEQGAVLHFDFAGDAAEGKDPAEIKYTVCAFDENLDIIAEGSFKDDFSNMAKYNLVITEDHHILYEGQAFTSGGDIFVSYTDASPSADISVMSASVAMPARPDAAKAINAAIGAYNDTFCGEQYSANKEAYEKGIADGATPALESFSMNRTVRVMRGDGAVLSFRMADRTSIGSITDLSIVTHNFNSQTGEELSINSIAKDSTKFTEFCAERVLVATTEEERFLTDSMIFVEGYTDNIRALISDGHWYFSSEGLVIAANPGDISTGFYEFVIPYDDLTDVLKEEYFPAELDGDYGNIALQLSKNIDISALSLIGDAPDASINSMIMTAAGNVYDINVYTGKYNSNIGSFTLDRQILFCSDMMRGAAIAINRAPADVSPDLIVSFTCPDGSVRKLLVSADTANGGLLVMDLEGGNEGIVVNGSMSYDLNGDGIEESVKLQSGDTVSVAVESESGATEIKSDAALRLYDLNGDGMMELYLSGKLENGEAVTYCFVYSEKLTSAGEAISGAVNEFNGNRLFAFAELDVLGHHAANAAYYFDSSANCLAVMNGFEYIFEGEETLTTTVAMALKDGTSIPANTVLQLKATDGSSYVKVSTDAGVGGVLSVSKDAMGQWTVNGQPASVCFKELA